MKYMKYEEKDIVFFQYDNRFWFQMNPYLEGIT